MADINFPKRVSYDQIVCPFCWVNTYEEHMKFVEGVGMVCNHCIQAKGLTPKVYKDCHICGGKAGEHTFECTAFLTDHKQFTVDNRQES